MPNKTKKSTPSQSGKIAAKLLDLADTVKAAQSAYKKAHSDVHKLYMDIEAKRLALESLQSSYYIELGDVRDFEEAVKAQKKLSRTYNAFSVAEERINKAQTAYDKRQNKKNLEELQAAREQFDKVKPRIGKDTGAYYEASEKVHLLVNAKRTSTQLEKALKDYELAVAKHQKSLPKLSKARQALDKVWADYEKHLLSIRRKKLEF